MRLLRQSGISEEEDPQAAFDDPVTGNETILSALDWCDYETWNCVGVYEVIMTSEKWLRGIPLPGKGRRRRRKVY